jgi:hypothetical protein
MRNVVVCLLWMRSLAVAEPIDAGAEPAPRSRGLVFEGGVGAGIVDFNPGRNTSAPALGLDVAVGGHLTPTLTLVGRVQALIASVPFYDTEGMVIYGEGTPSTIVAGLVGPSVEYRALPRLSIGIGASVATWMSSSIIDADLGAGIGLDARAAYDVGRGVALSAEVLRIAYPSKDPGIQGTNVYAATLSVGYRR